MKHSLGGHCFYLNEIWYVACWKIQVISVVLVAGPFTAVKEVKVKKGKGKTPAKTPADHAIVFYIDSE